MHHVMNNDIDLTDEIDDPDRTNSTQGIYQQNLRNNGITPNNANIYTEDMNRNLTDLSNPLNQFQEGCHQWLNMPSEIQKNIFQDDLSDNLTPNRGDARSPANNEVISINNN